MQVPCSLLASLIWVGSQCEGDVASDSNGCVIYFVSHCCFYLYCFESAGNHSLPPQSCPGN